MKTKKPAYYDCPRFETCCVNNCPLSEEKYISGESDPQPKCPMEKRVRMRIAKQHNLASSGLTSRENYWNSLSPEEQEKKKQILRENSPFLQLKQKGYAIPPIKGSKSSNTLLKQEKTSKTTPEEGFEEILEKKKNPLINALKEVFTETKQKGGLI
jgi:hypothetical protein